MRWMTVSILVVFLSAYAAQAQTPPAPKPAPPAQTQTPAAPRAAPTPPAQTQAPAPPKPAPAPTPPAQTPPAPAQAAAPAKPVLDATKLGTDFVDLLNTLDDWRISMDGKEVGIDKVVDNFMSHFAPDVLAEVPTDDEEQIGRLELVGATQLRKWVDHIARTRVELEFLLVRQTERSTEGEQMVYMKPLPWGGLGIAFQLIAPYSMRADRKSFLELGSVFLQYSDDQKIHRFRMYLSEKTPLEGGGRF
jgi:hypothetical protein